MNEGCLVLSEIDDVGIEDDLMWDLITHVNRFTYYQFYAVEIDVFSRGARSNLVHTISAEISLLPLLLSSQV